MASAEEKDDGHQLSTSTEALQQNKGAEEKDEKDELEKALERLSLQDKQLQAQKAEIRKLKKENRRIKRDGTGIVHYYVIVFLFVHMNYHIRCSY